MTIPQIKVALLNAGVQPAKNAKKSALLSQLEKATGKKISTTSAPQRKASRKSSTRGSSMTIPEIKKALLDAGIQPAKKANKAQLLAQLKRA